MLPLWFSDGDTLTGQLLPDFSGRDDERFWFDIEEVRALQQDTSNLYARLQTAVRGGWLTANEARSKVGLGPIDEKKGQVPLTQGEDNRLNGLTTAGLITLNEARASVGMDPTPGGDVLIKDLVTVVTPPGEEGSPAGNSAAVDNTNQSTNAVETGGTDKPKTEESKRQGSTTPGETPAAKKVAQQTKLPAKALFDTYVELVGVEAAFEMETKARDVGMTLSEMLASPELEETWTTLLSLS